MTGSEQEYSFIPFVYYYEDTWLTEEKSLYLKTFDPRHISGFTKGNINIKRVVTHKLHHDLWSATQPVPLENLFNDKHIQHTWLVSIELFPFLNETITVKVVKSSLYHQDKYCYIKIRSVREHSLDSGHTIETMITCPYTLCTLCTHIMYIRKSVVERDTHRKKKKNTGTKV